MWLLKVVIWVAVTLVIAMVIVWVRDQVVGFLKETSRRFDRLQSEYDKLSRKYRLTLDENNRLSELLAENKFGGFKNGN